MSTRNVVKSALRNYKRIVGYQYAIHYDEEGLCETMEAERIFFPTWEKLTEAVKKDIKEKCDDVTMSDNLEELRAECEESGFTCIAACNDEPTLVLCTCCF